jgi:DNA repair exonuclease SbcCD ATPase subunit
VNIKLLKLKLRNFKGIKEFELDAGDRNVNVYGDNATGKTTLFDAFTWLLFDKDSLDRKDFEIKTLETSGEPIHGLEHEVEGILEVDNKQIVLRKVFKEKWTKKKGSVQAEFTGHTTDYFIDGVPVKKSEYEAKILKIADESVFKLLTNPLYFNEQVHWQKRREILLQVCGDINDEEVINNNPALLKLPEILQGRNIEEHRKIIALRKSMINKELEKIPIRIDEVIKNIPEIVADEDFYRTKLTEVRQKLQQKQKELADAEAGGTIAEKLKLLKETEAAILNQINEAKKQKQEKIQAKQEEMFELQKKLMDLRFKAVVPELDTKALELEIEQLRKKWYEIKNEEITAPDVCPTCGQPFPQEKAQEIIAKFNREKAEKLEQITALGKEKKQKLEKMIQEYEAKKKEAEKVHNEVKALEEQIKQIGEEIKKLEKEEIKTDPKLVALQESIRKEIEDIKQNSETIVAKIKHEITEIEVQIQDIEKTLAQIEQKRQAEKRIEELKQQERELAAEYERLEYESYLTDEFIKTKVKLLEDKINSKFKLARFKLFDIQVNGAVVETCETTYQGVPYSDLNHGAKINIGLDIINTLSEYYNFSAPIFIDNAEAVTQLLETRGQQIRLIVSEKDKKLRVEVV